MIENLLKQRELLDAQINDVKTKNIRENIQELEFNIRSLKEKLSNAKERKRTSEIHIAEQYADLQGQLQKLRDISVADIYFVKRLENDLNENYKNLADNRSKLRETA
jgi:Rps23 Pro-64 3,4-dihydroxylase Tpa1-like proline 4-hydroxylase